MNCNNHPFIAAAGQCAQCGKSYCADCLVDVNGQKICSDCKSAVISQTQPAQPPMQTGQPTYMPPPPQGGQQYPNQGYQNQYQGMPMKCKEASEALTYAIVGLFCCGIILEPIAFIKATKAKEMIAMNPNLEGASTAQAAYVISIVGMVLWVLSIIVRIGQVVVAAQHGF